MRFFTMYKCKKQNALATWLSFWATLMQFIENLVNNIYHTEWNYWHGTEDNTIDKNDFFFSELTNLSVVHVIEPWVLNFIY